MVQVDEQELKQEQKKFKFDYYYKDKYSIKCSASCESIKSSADLICGFSVGSSVNNFNTILKKKQLSMVKYIQTYIKKNKSDIHKIHIASSTGLGLLVGINTDMTKYIDVEQGKINNVHFKVDKNNPELINKINSGDPVYKNYTLKKICCLQNKFNLALDVSFEIIASYTLRYDGPICFINIIFTVTSMQIGQNSFMTALLNEQTPKTYDVTHPKSICKYMKTNDLVDNIYNSLTTKS